MFGRYHGSQGRWKSWVNVVACGSWDRWNREIQSQQKNLEVENIFSILFVYILNFTIFEADPIVLDGLPLLVNFCLISGHQKCGMTSEPDVLSSAVHKSISKHMYNMSWGGKLMSTYELYDEICRICWWLENISFLWYNYIPSKNYTEQYDFEEFRCLQRDCKWSGGLTLYSGWTRILEIWIESTGKCVDFHGLATFEIDTFTIGILGNTFLDRSGHSIRIKRCWQGDVGQLASESWRIFPEI